MNTNAFEMINPDLIPKRKLNSGDEIPVIGLGTFGSDYYRPDEIAEAVKYAVHLGYRHIDCAQVYMNEKQIGDSITELITEKVVSREDLWITGKVWNDHHNMVEKACSETLKDLQLDYLDLYLVHWPFPNYHAPGCEGDARNPDSVPFDALAFIDTWKQMELLHKKGKVRNIGVSNMTIAKLKKVLPMMKVKPVVNEMELHPCFQQKELFDYLVQNDIQPIGYSPMGSPKRPARDKTESDAVDMEDPIVMKIARRLEVHPASVCISWAVQRGQIPIPFSVKPEQLISNLMATYNKQLTDDEMNEMEIAEKGSRLIKGQVFLWEGAKGWEDLWDMNGEIVTM